MRDGKELERHAQGSSKAIHFAIGRQAYIGLQLRLALQPMPDRPASSVTLNPRSSRHTVSGGSSSHRRCRAFHVISAMSQLREQGRMINRSRFFADDLIAAHPRRKMAGKRRRGLAAAMAIMMLKICLHKGRSTAQRDLQCKGKFRICDSVRHNTHENKSGTIQQVACRALFRSALIEPPNHDNLMGLVPILNASLVELGSRPIRI